MDPSFTDIEKVTPPPLKLSFDVADGWQWQRFVLAEIIKASQLDVNVLASFVNAQGIEPDWMQMQLPLGTAPFRITTDIRFFNQQC